ncbi:MAG: hypothetical protein ABIW38_10055 [Ferruginibacter sp.]
MKKQILITLSFITVFALGFAFKSFITNNNREQPLKRATGIGAFFLNVRNPKKSGNGIKTILG